MGGRGGGGGWGGGGAAALKGVGLEGNPAGEATVQALQGALRDRATFAAVQNVYLPRLR